MIKGSRLFVAAVFLGLAVACVDVRARPFDPTAPDGGASQPSFVTITRPTEGEAVSRTTLTEEPGLRVAFSGRFMLGQKLLVLVFGDRFPNTPLFASEGRIETVGESGSIHVRLTPTSLEGTSELEILMRILEGPGDRIISTDSVGVSLR